MPSWLFILIIFSLIGSFAAYAIISTKKAVAVNEQTWLMKAWKKDSVKSVTSSLISIACAKPFVNTVFPLPKSPLKQITIFGNFSDSIFCANSIVSSSEYVVILYSISITYNLLYQK